MPGIMPMKIIKVGSAAQSRVAQACDRCRSKKIRCDGITPCCSQCANVGFECKTSDKLSRRAFPRGYTESLEERVRQLECEVRDLKGLLDEKDEKIDLLSKFHDFSTRRPSIPGPTLKQEIHSPSSELDESEVFSVKNPNNLLRISTRCEPHWAGASSSSAYLDIFKSKAAAAGRAVPPVSPRALFSVKGLSTRRPAGGHARRPPRLVSDRLVNVYLQEFAPFLPVLYRPAFLQRYKEFADGFDDIENHHAVAQLNLVFSIASTACEFGREHVAAFDNHWQSALNAVIHDNSLSSLQCLILAQLCCLVKGDSNRVLHYAGIAVIMSRRLGLHRAQATLQLDPLTTEIRKRTFWCLYTLDTFTAANLGLPRLIKDEIVQTEAPINVDDEDLFESRLSSPNPETKMSVALAFFNLSRILARIIDSVYQSPFKAGVSLSTISHLSEDLNAWREALAPHLRLIFAQDKPSTRITGDRSPLLSLAYYHARALLYRPLATSDLGAKAVPGVIALADACKHIVQIAQLLDERHMSFSLPMNKHEVLVNAGLGLLYQGLTLQGGKSYLVNDSQRLVCEVISILDTVAAPCATDFKALACSLITVDGFARRRPSSTKESVSPRSSVSMTGYSRPRSQDMAQPQSQSQGQRRPSQSNTSPTSQSSLGSRRANFPGKLRLQENHNAIYAQHSASSAKIPMLTPMRSEPILRKTASLPVDPRAMLAAGAVSNLDYLPLGDVTQSPSPIPGATPSHLRSQQADSAGTPWDRILGCLNDNPNGGAGTGSILESTAKSSPMDIFGDQLSLHTGVDGSASWADPASATAWGTDTTSVPSVFDDSGASFTSGEDRTSLDLGSRQTMGKDMNVFGGLDMGAGSLVDEFSAALPGMDDGLAF